MIEKLKPCPFCGGEARLFANEGVRVYCKNCHASTRILTDNAALNTSAVQIVIENWNKRAEEDIE